MNRLFALFFAVLYLLPLSGLQIDYGYCGELLTSVSVNSADKTGDPCSFCHKSSEKKDCCQTVQRSFRLSDQRIEERLSIADRQISAQKKTAGRFVFSRFCSPFADSRFPARISVPEAYSLPFRIAYCVWRI